MRNKKLTERLLSVLLCLAMVITSLLPGGISVVHAQSPGDGANLLDSLTGRYEPWVDGIGTTNISNISGGYRFEITGYEGYQDYMTRVLQENLNLDQGKRYKVKFNINSSVDRKAVVRIEDADNSQVFHYAYDLKAGNTKTIEVVTDTLSQPVSGGSFYVGLGMAHRDGVTVAAGPQTIEVTNISMAETTDPATDLAVAEYNLVWSDEFDGDTLDPTKWSYQIGTKDPEGGPENWGNNEKEYYTDQNATVSGGALTITAKREEKNGMHFTSSRIRTVKNNSNKLFTTKYGRIEAKMKLPTGNGVWPAFWMLPYQSPYGGWASSGEIDIMESVGQNPEYVNGTIHYGGPWGSNKSSGSAYNFPAGQSTADWHVYTLEWEPGKLTWFVDGNEYYSTSEWYSDSTDNGDAIQRYPAPFDTEFYILFNLAAGGNYVGNPDVDQIEITEDNPAEMLVDYVRVYHKKEGYDESNVQRPNKDKDTAAFDSYQSMKDGEGSYVTDRPFDTVNTTGITDGTITPENRVWYFLVGSEFGGTAALAKEVIDGTAYARVNVQQPGNAVHSVQLLQHFPVARGYSYVVEFDAKADAACDISSKVGGDAGEGWAVYSNQETISLTEGVKHYRYTFTMDKASDPTSRLEFNLGLNTNKNIYIGNVTVKIDESASNEDSSKDPMDSGNFIYNGTFYNDLRYWHLNDATGNSAVEDKVLKMDASGNAVTLVQKGIQLTQTDEYTLTFDAKAASGTSVTVQPVFKKQDGSVLVQPDAITVDSSGMQKKTVDITIPADQTDLNGIFELSAASGCVYIDNIKLVRNTDNNIDWDSLVLYPLLNGDFGAGAQAWTAHQTNMGIAQESGNSTLWIEGSPLSNAWDKMLIYPGMTMYKNYDYELSFKVKYTGEGTTQPLEVKLENASYATALVQKVDVTKDWQTFNFSFKSTLGGSIDLKYLLGYVSDNTTFFFDDVELKVKNAPRLEPAFLYAQGPVKTGQDVNLAFSEKAGSSWSDSASMQVFVNGAAVPAGKFTISKSGKTITIDKSLFSEAGKYQIYAKAEGYSPSNKAVQTVLTDDGNIVINGDFTNGLDPWTDWEKDGSGAVSTEAGKLKVEYYAPGYDGPGPVIWSIQVKQDISLEADKTYDVSFDASSTIPREISLEMGSLGSQTASITEVMKNYKVSFTAANTGNYTMNFLLGTLDVMDPHTMYFDNIVVKEHQDEPEPSPGPTDDPSPTPGTNPEPSVPTAAPEEPDNQPVFPFVPGNEKVDYELTVNGQTQEFDGVLKNDVIADVIQKGSDVTVTIRSENGAVQSSWSFEGAEVKKFNKAADMKLGLSVIPASSSRALSTLLAKDKNNSSGLSLTFDEKGTFPVQAKVKVYIGEQEGITAGGKVYVYRYNADTKKLDTIKGGYGVKTDKQGYLTLDYLAGGQYIILPKPASTASRTMMTGQAAVDKTKTVKAGKTAVIKVTAPSTARLVTSFGKADMAKVPSGAMALKVTYSSSNTKIAAVNSKTGKLTAKKAGKVIIKAVVETETGLKKTYKTTVTVK